MYRMFMPKKPLSVTLDDTNILWLRGRAHAGKERSLSEALDGLVTSARQSGYGGDVRSVAGTIDVSPEDPDLATADAGIRAMFEAWLGAPAAAPPRRTPVAGRRGRARKSARRG